MIKKAMYSFIVGLCTVVTVACGSQHNDAKSSLHQIDADEMKVVDSMGREVIVKKDIDNIASTFAPITHIICMLGDSEKIQSMPAGNMRDRLLVDLYPSISDCRTPKGSGKLNMEELFKEPAPDVIFCDPASVSDPDIMGKLERFNVPIVAVDFRNLEQQKYAIELVGKVLGKEEKAKKYNDNITRTYELVVGRIEEYDEEKSKTLYHSVNELLRTDIAESVPVQIIGDIKLNQLGVKEVEGFNDAKNYIALEDLMFYNPEYIIVNGEDVYDYIESNDRLHVLDAYKSKKIYNLPVGVSRWGQSNSIETPVFMLWLGKTIYPDAFQDIDMNVEVKEFYKNYFDADLDDETAAKILEGRGLRELINRNNSEK